MRRRFLIDVVLNTLAGAAPLVVLQLLVLPILSRHSSSAEYGRILSLISIMSLAAVFGTSLNNARLIVNNAYEEQGERGDFNVLLLSGGALVSLIALVGGTSMFAGSASAYFYVLFGIATFLSLLREYMLVGFRLRLSFVQILVNNVLLAAGYLLGLAIALRTDQWYYVYIVGQSISLIHLQLSTGLLRESWHKTSSIGKTAYLTAGIGVTALLASLTGAADRLLLFPILGGHAVAVYYVSSIFGKLVGVAVNPISSVILSYLSRMSDLPRKTFTRWLVAAVCLASTGYFAGLLASALALPVLYPELSMEASAYVPWTTGSAMVSVVAVALKPVLLRYRHINWQLGISAITAGLYLLGASLGALHYGVHGFAAGVLFALTAKVMMMLIVYWWCAPTTTDADESRPTEGGVSRAAYSE